MPITGVRKIRLFFEIPDCPPGDEVWEVKARVLDDGEIYNSAIILVRAFGFDEPPVGKWWLHGLIINGHNQLAIAPRPDGSHRVPFSAVCNADELKLDTQRPGQQIVLRVANGGNKTQTFRCTMHAVTPRGADA